MMAKVKENFFIKVKRKTLDKLKTIFKEEEEVKPQVKKIAFDKPSKISIIKPKIKNFLSSPDIKAILNFFSYVAIYGLILNIGLLIFGFSLSLFSWISFGMFIWFVENKFISLIRALFRK